MAADDSVDLLHCELIQRDNPGLSANTGRQDRPRLLLAVDLHDDPGAVHPIQAPPIGVREKMGAAREKGLNDTSTRQLFSLMLNFNEKSGHSRAVSFLTC